MKNPSRAKLTKATIEQALKSGVERGKAHRVLWDDALVGLGLKIRPTGSASWIVVYRPKGAGGDEPSRTLTLGRWPQLDVSGARAAATIAAGEIAKGGDPSKERAAQRKRERWSVERVSEAYEADLKRRRFVKVRDRLASLRVGLEPLLQKELAALTRADLVSRIDEREARGLGSDDLRKAINGVYNFAIGKGIVSANPLAGLQRPKATRAEMLAQDEHGRALSDHEIARVWNASLALGSFGALVRMALLSGCRKNELATLKWRDIDDDKIRISATVAKMARVQEIPLTDAMRSIIAQQRFVRGTAGADSLVFPSVDGSHTKISGWTPLLLKIRKSAGFSPRGDASDPMPGDWWSMHDLRRTCRTIMSIEGVDEGLAELALGHVTAGLVRTYNRDRRSQGIRDAFEKVSARIEQLLPLAPENVVTLKRRAAQ